MDVEKSLLVISVALTTTGHMKWRHRRYEKDPGQTKVTSKTSDAATRPDKHRALPEPEGELRTVWNAWWKSELLGIGVAVRPTAAVGASVYPSIHRLEVLPGTWTSENTEESMSQWTELNVRNIKWI